ncbi:hypothetical protein N7468_010540 [Penicillium chermesinum]|uniref:Uncharacterized protein n=1 Tax=Penicillium chermesinum TaxID=63820 RepID=A0A9W9N7Y4_9EURO|nr:uncharacterized protein N7468_010540 [Penicillium chermesinum]KAJ5214861.1 hypothetical protein N7468_010540 [Penicillium chermesinum]
MSIRTAASLRSDRCFFSSGVKFDYDPGYKAARCVSRQYPSSKFMKPIQVITASISWSMSVGWCWLLHGRRGQYHTLQRQWADMDGSFRKFFQ